MSWDRILARRLPGRMRRTALRGLSSELGRERAAAIVARADEQYPGLAARIPKSRIGARDLLRTSAYAVALHEALVTGGFGPEEANALVADVVSASVMPARTAVHRLTRLRHRDLLERARWGAQVARRLYYAAPDWEMKDVAVVEGFGFDVTRCVVAEYFDSLGRSELCQRAICDQDVRSATHHGIVLERSQTLAASGDRCDFRYSVPVTVTAGRSDDRGPALPAVLSTGVLEDTVEVDASPNEVWSWLVGIADHYTHWHPDHVSAHWKRGLPNQVGSQLEAVEDVAGHREALVFEVTDVEPPWRMEYRIRGPHSLVLPGGAFEISPVDRGTVFRATIRYRFGRLAEAMFRRRIAALRSHMREEGQHLKRLVEAGPGAG